MSTNNQRMIQPRPGHAPKALSNNPTYRQQQEQYHALLGQWATETHRRMMRDMSMQPLYLYYIPSTALNGEWAKLITAAEHETPDAPAELITAERIPIGRTRDQLYAWIVKLASRLHMFPMEVKK